MKPKFVSETSIACLHNGDVVHDGSLLIAGVGGLGSEWAKRAHARCADECDLLLVDADDSSFEDSRHAHCLPLGDSSDAGCAALPELAASHFMKATAIMDKLNVPMSIGIDQRIEGAAKVGSHKTSMLQDYERGKELELDALVVAVKEIADLLGIKTPTIDRILHTVTEKISKNN